MNDEDIHNNLLTGITSGYYLYFRKIYNDIQLNTADFDYTHQYKAKLLLDKRVLLRFNV